MAWKSKEPITGQQLVTGVIGTIDLGSIIAKVIDIQAEIKSSEQQLTEVYKIIEALKTKHIPEWQLLASKDFTAIKEELGTRLIASNQQIAFLTKSAALSSAVGASASATMIGLRGKLYSSLFGISQCADALLGIPQGLMLDKAVRYWNMQIAPYYPSERDCFMLYRNNKWDKTKYTTMLREMQGITATDADNLTELREWQTGQPSLRDAFLMVYKGLMPLSSWIQLAMKGYGFKLPTATALFAHFTYDFSMGELLRLSDLIPLESSWVDKKLDALGLDTTDKAIVKSAIEKRGIRDEVNKIWATLLDNYQWGLMTEAYIRERLSVWKFSTTEIDIRVETAELAKLKLRVKLMRDAEVYLYRAGTVTEDELLDRLTNLGISKDIANAVVRYEAAKKGVEWEIPVD